MKIAIVDYGMGNLRSVQKALEHLGHPADISSNPEAVLAADKVILPGVGAFGAAMKNLRSIRSAQGVTMLDAVKRVIAEGRPFFGICLGMQLLLTSSEEQGHHEGLGVVPGAVPRFERMPGLKVPHMGWNSLKVLRRAPELAGIPDGAMVYFVHSYYCAPDDPDVRAAVTEHGIEFCSALWQANVFATQFHPEKSGDVGLSMLEAFARR